MAIGGHWSVAGVELAIGLLCSVAVKYFCLAGPSKDGPLPVRTWWAHPT